MLTKCANSKGTKYAEIKFIERRSRKVKITCSNQRKKTKNLSGIQQKNNLSNENTDLFVDNNRHTDEKTLLPPGFYDEEDPMSFNHSNDSLEKTRLDYCFSKYCIHLKHQPYTNFSSMRMIYNSKHDLIFTIVYGSIKTEGNSQKSGSR